MTKNSLSIKDVYVLVDNMRKEINASINRLEDRFVKLEEGRLSVLENTVSKIQGKMVAVTGTIAFFISLIISIIQIIINK